MRDDDNSAVQAEASITASISYRAFRTEVLEQVDGRWKTGWNEDNQPSAFGALRTRILAIRSHLLWHGKEWIEKSRYPKAYIYRALGLHSDFVLPLSRRDRWLRRWMYFVSAHTVMRYARSWLLMARTYEGREFIFRQRVPRRIAGQSIHYSRALDFGVMRWGRFASATVMDRFSLLPFDWIRAAEHLGLDRPEAMLEWIPWPPKKDAGEMLWVLAQHGIITKLEERDWVQEYQRPFYYAYERQLDSKLIGEITDTLLRYDVAREQIVKTLCTVPHHQLKPELLERTLALLVDRGVDDTTQVLAGLDRCLTAAEPARWVFLLDVLGVRDSRVLVQFRRILESDRPYSVELAVALAARCTEVSAMAQFQELLLAAGCAREPGAPVAALELLMSAPHQLSLSQIAQAKDYLCQPSELGRFLKVLDQSGFGDANAVLSFQSCYSQVHVETVSRLIALTQSLGKREPANVIADWVTQVGRTGYSEAYEYLARTTAVRTLPQLRQVAKLGFLGVPLLRYLVEDRKLSTWKDLTTWFYSRAFGIKSLRWWDTTDPVSRLLLEDAFDRGAFNFLEANRQCIEDAVEARVTARIGALRDRHSDHGRATYKVEFAQGCEAERTALLPVLSLMLQATSGILFRTVLDRAWDGPAAFEMQLKQLMPLLDDLLAGRGPVEATLTQLEAEAIGLVYRTSPDTIVRRWREIINHQSDIAEWGLAPSYHMAWRNVSRTLVRPLDADGFEAVRRAAAIAESLRLHWAENMAEACKFLVQPVDAMSGLTDLVPSVSVLLAIAANEPGIASWLQNVPTLLAVKDESGYEELLQAHALFDVRLPDAIDAHCKGFCRDLSEQSALLLAHCLGEKSATLENAKEVLQATLMAAGFRVRGIFGAWFAQEKDKFQTKEGDNHGTELSAVVTKYPAAFFAKEAAKLCTAANATMWQEERHAHMVVYDLVHKSLQGMALLYREVLPSLHASRPVLVIRAINPTDDAMASYDVGTMVDAFLSTAVQIACDTGCVAVLFPANTGMHFLSNLDAIDRDIGTRYADSHSKFIGRLTLDGKARWLRPAQHVDAAFDAYERGASQTDSLYLLWQGSTQ